MRLEIGYREEMEIMTLDDLSRWEQEEQMIQAGMRKWEEVE